MRGDRRNRPSSRLEATIVSSHGAPHGPHTTTRDPMVATCTSLEAMWRCEAKSDDVLGWLMEARSDENPVRLSITRVHSAAVQPPTVLDDVALASPQSELRSCSTYPIEEHRHDSFRRCCERGQLIPTEANTDTQVFIAPIFLHGLEDPAAVLWLAAKAGRAGLPQLVQHGWRMDGQPSVHR